MKKMTIEEFNKNYHIQVILVGTQNALLMDHYEELDYTEVLQPIANTAYQVYDKNWDLVLEVETEDDGIFIEALLEKFDIKELKEKK